MLKNLIYIDIMEIQSNHYFKNIDEKMPIKYRLNVVKNAKDIGIMISHFLKFIKAKYRNRTISMDFEFNNCSFKKGDEYTKCMKNSIGSKEIAIFQILLEDDSLKTKNDVGNIFLFYPEDLSEKQKKILIDLLTAPDIKKIIHGGESLDIPYLFKMLFKDEESKINFCSNLYDTKYICEYHHLVKKTEDKCKIYYFLKEMDIISNDQFEIIIKNEEDMGPIWFINLDIKKLNDNVVLYSSFDVLFLKSLLNKLVESNSKDEIDIVSGISSINFLYKMAVPEISNFIDKITTYNVHMLYDKDNNIVKFLDIFDLYYYWYDDNKKIFSKLTDINSFKRFIQSILKIYLYLHFSVNDINTNYGKFKSSLKDNDKKFIKEINEKYFSFISKLEESNGFQKTLDFIDTISNSIKNDLLIIKSKMF